MPNKARGEAALAAGGNDYRLLLTLGALAEIEDGLGLEDLSQVSTRLRTLRAADLAIVAAALLRGGGHNICPADVLKLACDLGSIVRAVREAFEAAGLNDAKAEGAQSPFPGSAGSNLASA
ncbi:MAG TPA: GTA-gp10 family protein [Rhizomicrobium sp.]|nr:GTA-gp10 family protein [Rhizomicrobium sp.]